LREYLTAPELVLLALENGLNRRTALLVRVFAQISLVGGGADAFHLLSGQQVSQGVTGVLRQLVGSAHGYPCFLDRISDLGIRIGRLVDQVNDTEVLVCVLDVVAELVAPAVGYHDLAAVGNLVGLAC
jgi:hypothetical protein